MTDIHHDAGTRQFSTEVDGHLAHVDYETGTGRIVITHTIVPEAIGGRGIAAALVRAALEYARDHGLQVEPQCSYADVWMRRHPEFDALRG
ncbi:MAG: N-acetyltransferase [Xanthomonadaceae bacterium]|nr:N-acetyltransferase [Xanthomonadaceae bacterium]